MSSLPSSQPPLKARLVCRVRPGKTQTIEVRAPETILGRKGAGVVSLPVDDISRRHARISWDGESYWIEDLRSTNGTFLNGRRLTKDKLRHLSVIRLGRDLNLVFLLRAQEPAPIRMKGIRRAALVQDAPNAAPREIPMGQITLGRSVACNVVVQAPEVSKLHSRLERTERDLVVQDLGSSNGTFVNGRRVDHATLSDGDVISLANQEVFRVLIEMGEMTLSSTIMASADLGLQAAPPAAPRIQFPVEWKERVEDGRAGRPAEPPPVKTTRKTPALPQSEERLERKPAAPPSVAIAGVPTRVEGAPTGVQAAVQTGVEARRTSEPTATPRIVEVRLRGTGIELVAAKAGPHDLGRSKNAPLRIDKPSVSRRHARIVITPDMREVLLEDLGSANGTLLNGQRLKKPEPLAEGDVIGLGGIELKVSLKKG